MKKYIILIVSIISLLGTCSADLAGYTIDSYTAEFELNGIGDLKVSENIDIDFYEKRHGIYRSIPYKYSNYYITPVEDVSISGYKYTTRTNGNNFVIQIGDEFKTVTGIQNYHINYRVKGTVKEFNGYQELYRNILGTDWNTDVNNFNFKIELPYEIELTNDDIWTYAGKIGSTGSIDVNIDGKSITNIQPLNFGAGEGLTIAVKLPQNYLSAKNYRTSEFTYIGLFIGIVLVLWIALTIYIIHKILSKYIKRRKELKELETKNGHKIRNNIYYNPPKGYTAAEVAAIYNRSPDYSILSAYLFSWVISGYVKVEEGEDTIGLFRINKSFQFKKTDKSPKFQYDKKWNGDEILLKKPEELFRNLCFILNDINKLNGFSTVEIDILKSVVDEVYFKIITKFVPKWKELYKLKQLTYKNIDDLNAF